VLGLVKWPVALAPLALLPGAALAFKTELELARNSFDAVAPFLTGIGGYTLLWVLVLRRRATLHGSFWSTLEHEATHILFTLLTLGRVRGLLATHRNGGQMQHHGSGNWLVAISPYFFPTLSGAVMLIMLALDGDALRTAELILGVTVAYHVASTYSETNRHQTDLQLVGFRFSWAFLPAANIASFGMIFGMARNGTTGLGSFYTRLWTESGEFWTGVQGVIR
jgi:hypothetical protein